jgi:hypothetical protein
MIVDLDSWEAGYDDGLFGRPSQCTPSLDRLSYSNGYVQARSCCARTQEVLRRHYTRPSTPRTPQRYGGGSRLIII